MIPYKKVPSFWKDLDIDRNIVSVESDHPDYPVIKEKPWDGCEFADKAMDEAEDLIKDLREGRVDFRKVAKEPRK